MNPSGLRSLLERLLATGENEVVEFKRENRNGDTDKIGQYSVMKPTCATRNVHGLF